MRADSMIVLPMPTVMTLSVQQQQYRAEMLTLCKSISLVSRWNQITHTICQYTTNAERVRRRKVETDLARVRVEVEVPFFRSQIYDAVDRFRRESVSETIV
jgi:hypothetical protein